MHNIGRYVPKSLSLGGKITDNLHFLFYISFISQIFYTECESYF